MSGFIPDFNASRDRGDSLFGEKMGRGSFVGSRRPLLQSDFLIKQNFDYECTVMIWPTSEGLLGGLNGRPGHASVLLRRLRDEGPFLATHESGFGRYPKHVRYVSFWPSGDPDQKKKGELYFSPRDANFLSHHCQDYVNEISDRATERLQQVAIRREGQILVWTDPEVYGQLPGVLISLKGMGGASQTTLGLDMSKILDWCHEFKKSPDFNYKYISSSNNCAGVAVRALSAGGAEAFAAVGGCSAKSSIYITPNDAGVWAKAVAVGIQKVNQWTSKLMSDGRPTTTPWKTQLPTVAEWKAASHKSFSFRGKETRAVDDALAVWHECLRVNDPKSFPKSFGAFVQLIQHTHMHMQKDPNSIRSEAYTDLAGSIIRRVWKLVDNAEADWHKNEFTGTSHNRPAANRT